MSLSFAAPTIVKCIKTLSTSAPVRCHAPRVHLSIQSYHDLVHLLNSLLVHLLNSFLVQTGGYQTASGENAFPPSQDAVEARPSQALPSPGPEVVDAGPPRCYIATLPPEVLTQIIRHVRHLDFDPDRQDLPAFPPDSRTPGLRYRLQPVIFAGFPLHFVAYGRLQRLGDSGTHRGYSR